MYETYYGFADRPFALTPDPRFYFESTTHRKAMSYLGYGLAQGEGFIVITGDIGAGKTTLVGHLMATIDKLRLTAVKVVSTQVAGDDMLRLVAQNFGIDTQDLAKAQLLARIESFLHAQARSGKRTLLIVDEAQNLPIETLEELRMLSNFQLGGQALLQIFLLGQPEFRNLLNRDARLEQLRQRVIATHHLDPMLETEIAPYIEHRMALVGWTGNPRITPDAYDAIHRASGGVPRRVNMIASRMLLMGAIEHSEVIDSDMIAAVVEEMGEGEARDLSQAEPVAADYPPTFEPQGDAVLSPTPTPAAMAPEDAVPAEDGPALDTVQDGGQDENDAGYDRVFAHREDEMGEQEYRPIRNLQAVSDEPAPREEEADQGPRLAWGHRADPDARVEALERRLAEIEERLHDQDSALRQMLALLIEWVEREEQSGYQKQNHAA